MTLSNGNGVWKWVAGGLLTILMMFISAAVAATWQARDHTEIRGGVQDNRERVLLTNQEVAGLKGDVAEIRADVKEIRRLLEARR